MSPYALTVQALDSGSAMARFAVLCALARDAGLITDSEAKRLADDLIGEFHRDVRAVIARALVKKTGG